jgi:hypothetical protein
MALQGTPQAARAGLLVREDGVDRVDVDLWLLDAL